MTYPGAGRHDLIAALGPRPSVRQRRMHHHDKHAATKDGHRPDDPNAVTSNKWKQQQIDALTTERHAGGIRREGHEVFDENVDYGQRVSAFGNVERNVSDEQGGGYDVQGDEMVDLVEGEEDQAFAKVGTYGQEFPDAWSTDSPDRFSVPASKVHGSIGRDQIMIDASSTGGGETDSHLLNFTTTESSVKELQKGKWRAEGTRNVAGPKRGQVHWQMHPEK